MFASCSLLPKSEKKETDKVEVYRSPISGKEIRMEGYKISHSEKTNDLYEGFVKDKIPEQREGETYYNFNVRKASHFVDINNMIPDQPPVEVSRTKLDYIAMVYNEETKGSKSRTVNMLLAIGIVAILTSFLAVWQILRVQQQKFPITFYPPEEKLRDIMIVIIPTILISLGMLLAYYYLATIRIPDVPLYQLILYEIYGGG